MPNTQPGLIAQIVQIAPIARTKATFARGLSGAGAVFRQNNGPMLAAILVGAVLAGQWLLRAVPSAHAEPRALEVRGSHSAPGVAVSDRPGLIDESTPDLAILLSQASQYQPEQVRQPALARLQSVPQLSRALATALQGPERDQALTYLESNDPIDGSTLAEPVRAAILGMAAALRDEIRRTPTLRGDHFVPQVRRVLAAADKFEPYGVDYLPAVRAVRAALAEPHPQGGELRCRQVLERWLAKR